ncbi:MAG: ribonuclease PH [Planctomycetota bacterium]|nr:ribonuclease PH [Planctomycetota bacterium]
MSSKRLDGRTPDALRPIQFTRHWLPEVPGSVLAEFGGTRVLCTAIVENTVPHFLQNTGEGWVTAEYDMIPASTGTRHQRRRGSRPDGRAVEIQRLVGRALRCIVNRKAIPGRTVWVDCDVLAADGGTRTTAINGAYVALHDAFTALKEDGSIKQWPLTESLQAVSVGIVEDTTMADLNYYEDSSAEVDMNLVMTGSGRLIEINGGAERSSFSLEQLNALLDVGQSALVQIAAAQEAALQP